MAMVATMTWTGTSDSSGAGVYIDLQHSSGRVVTRVLGVKKRRRMSRTRPLNIRVVASLYGRVFVMGCNMLVKEETDGEGETRTCH